MNEKSMIIEDVIKKSKQYVIEKDEKMAKAEKDIKIENLLQSRDTGYHIDYTERVTKKYFYNALKMNKKIGNIGYNEILNNWQRGDDKYDIILINGNSIAVIEVKTLAKLKDLKKLLNKQLPRFKKFFPQYKDFDLYVGFASYYANDEIRNFAKENGIYLLERFGDHIETISGDIRHW